MAHIVEYGPKTLFHFVSPLNCASGYGPAASKDQEHYPVCLEVT